MYVLTLCVWRLNMQGFMWTFVCIIYKFPFLPSFMPWQLYHTIKHSPWHCLVLWEGHYSCRFHWAEVCDLFLRLGCPGGRDWAKGSATLSPWWRWDPGFVAAQQQTNSMYKWTSVSSFSLLLSPMDTNSCAFNNSVYITNNLYSSVYITNNLHNSVYITNNLHNSVYITNSLYSSVYITNSLYSSVYITNNLSPPPIEM